MLAPPAQKHVIMTSLIIIFVSHRNQVFIWNDYKRFLSACILRSLLIRFLKLKFYNQHSKIPCWLHYSRAFVTLNSKLHTNDINGRFTLSSSYTPKPIARKIGIKLKSMRRFSESRKGDRSPILNNLYLTITRT